MLAWRDCADLDLSPNLACACFIVRVLSLALESICLVPSGALLSACVPAYPPWTGRGVGERSEDIQVTIYWAGRPGRPGRARTSRQPSAAHCEISRRGHKSTGQGRVPRLEQSTQLHTNPSQPPVHSRLLPRPPHCRTGPLPLATPLVCTVRKLPRIHPPSPSPCLLPPQRLKGPVVWPVHDSFAACLSNRSCLVILHHIPFFLFIPTPPSRPLTLVLLFIIAVPPSA